MTVKDEYTERFERDLARARKFLSEIEGLATETRIGSRLPTISLPMRLGLW
jgi:hypothetical protein